VRILNALCEMAIATTVKSKLAGSSKEKVQQAEQHSTDITQYAQQELQASAGRKRWPSVKVRDAEE